MSKQEQRQLYEKPLWWKEESNFDKIVILAENILRSFPNSRIFSLGQSSAWIVKAAELLTRNRGEKKEFGHIPFSGSFLEEGTVTGAYHLGNRPIPDRRSQLNYRKLLKSIGLSPAEIVLRYTDKAIKTSIFEYTNSGRSVASFTMILYSWAQEEGIELNEALNIVTFARYNALPPVKYISIYSRNIYKTCNNVYAENDMLVALANGVDDGPNSDRLVPYYPHRFWDNPPVKSVENNQYIIKLEKRLECTIQNHLGNCTSAVDKQLVTEVLLVNNTVTSGLPLSLPSAPRSAISGNSMDFSQSVPEGSLFMALAMFAFSFLGVGMVVKMRARTKPQAVQSGVAMEEGFLGERINSAAANLHEGIKKFGAYDDEFPESSLSGTTTSARLSHKIPF